MKKGVKQLTVEAIDRLIEVKSSQIQALEELRAELTKETGLKVTKRKTRRVDGQSEPPSED